MEFGDRVIATGYYRRERTFQREWVCMERIPCYLVAFPNCNPLYVPVDCIKPVESEQ